MKQPNVSEMQTTTTDGDLISGELLIRFTNISIHDFLQYRKTIREITGFGDIRICQTTIAERALVAQNRLETKPDEFRDAQTAPMPQDFGGGIAVPASHLPGQEKPPRTIAYIPPPEEKKVRIPKIHPKMREFLLTFVGKEQNDILDGYRRRFKHTKISNQGILDMYNQVHNLG